MWEVGRWGVPAPQSRALARLPMICQCLLKADIGAGLREDSQARGRNPSWELPYPPGTEKGHLGEMPSIMFAKGSRPHI